MRKNSVLPVKYEKEEKESPLTSFGGAPIFLEFLKSMDFDHIVSRHLKSTSNQGFHPFHHLLSLVLVNILGGESVSDISMIERDFGLKRFLEKYKNYFLGFVGREFRKSKSGFFPSATSLFTFLNSFKSSQEEAERESTPKGKCKILPTADKLENLSAVNRDIISVAQTLAPKSSATLDMDNNIILSNKRNAKVSYKKNKSYQPFNVYWAEQDLMVHSEFRDGNVPPGFEQLRVLKDALKQLPASVKKVQVRSDSAGYQHDFLEYMESGKSRFGKIEFAVSSNVTQSFRSAVLGTPEDKWTRVTDLDDDGNQIETNHEVAEICFVPETKNKSKKAPVFRYLATREVTDIQIEFSDTGQMMFVTSENAEKKLHLEVFKGSAYKIFGIVTNKSGLPSDILHWHRKRCGKSEQEHSRLTKDMAGGRFPSGDFGPNAAWWQIAIISLNLLKIFQRQTLPAELKNARIKKLHRELFHIAIRIIKRSGGLIVKISQELPLYNIIQSARRRIVEIEQILKKAKIWCKNSALIC